MKCWYDSNITCLADCELIEECQAREIMLKTRADSIDECIKEIDDVDWIESDYLIKLLKQLKEQNKCGVI